MAGPLAGIRVLDLSRILAGPWAAQTLADLGAEVIKVERPVTGDDTRHWGPPYLKDKNGKPTEESAYYLSANRGKKSIAVDISKPEGQQIIQALAKQSDVLIENYKVGGLKQYGLDYASLEKVHPRLVYCSITGFGQTGPYAQRPGYDFMIQAMGGLMSVTGERDDLPGGGPQRAGVAIADILTGLYATIGIQAALAEREKSGKGQYIDLALMDVQTACLANQGMNFLVSGQPPTRLGNGHPNIVPYQAFATQDGHIILAVGNDRQFQKFCDVARCPELAKDERFIINSLRVAHRDTLCPLISEKMVMRTSEDWLTALNAAGVPCGPINSIDQVFADPQVRSRNMLQELKHPLAGQVPVINSPLKYSRSTLELEQAPPLLGEHTLEVLTEVLHYSEQKIEELERSKAIGPL